MNRVTTAYLSSYVLSLLGNSVAAIALPLIIFGQTGSALSTGVVAASTAIPAVLAGLLMGVVIDRINRRTCSIVTDLISAVSIAALPVVDMVTGLTVGWFVLFGVIGSLGDVPGLTARDALLPAIVRHSRMDVTRLMGIREGLAAVAILLGPAAAGTLIVLFDGSTVLWITAATSLGAALISLLIPRRVGEIPRPAESGPAATGGTWMQLRAGWSVLFRSRFLLAMTALSLTLLVVLSALLGLVLPVYFTRLDEPGLLGFVMSALALGMLIGGGLYAIVGSRIRRRGWFVAGIAGTTAGLGLVAALPGIGWVLAGASILGFSSGLVGSLIGVLMIERIPERMRGRVMGTQNALTSAAPGVGILFTGVLTEYAGVNAASIAVAAIWAVVAVAALFARSLRNLEAEPGETSGGSNDQVVDR